MIISTVIVLGLFCFLSYALAHIPEQRQNTHFATYQDYINIFDVLPRVYLSSLIGMLIGYYINAKIIVKWKKLLNGKYFLIRSIGSSTIGEAFYTSIAVILICVGRYPLALTIHFIIITYLITLVLTLIFASPGALTAALMKKIGEGESSSLQPNNLNTKIFQSN